MSRRRNNNRSLNSNLLIALFILALVGLIIGFMSLKDYITTEMEQKKLKEGFNENEFRQKLITSLPIIEALKEEFPTASIETTNSGFTNPTSLEDFEIKDGDYTVSILVSTYHKGTYLDFVNDSNVEFDEIEGKLQYIYIVAGKEETPIDSTIMKRIFKSISTGLGYKLNENQISDLVDELKSDNSASPYPNPFLTFYHQDKENEGGGRNLPWSGQVLTRTVKMQLFEDKEVEKAFKVIYDIKE